MDILSKNSIESDWVETEVQAALEKEPLCKQTVLFPIRVDNTMWNTTQAWAANLRRERNIGDFYGWNRSIAKYNEALDRLLRDLKAEDAKAAE